MFTFWQEMVDVLHAKYMEEIQSLFDTHKADAGYSADETLLIV